MSSEADFDTELFQALTLKDRFTDPIVQGAVAALVSGNLHRLDPAQGDQLCHMRSVLVVRSSREIRKYLEKADNLKDAERLAAEWHRLSSEHKVGDERFDDEYKDLIRTCYEVLGDRRMEIAKLCLDTKRGVTWVSTPMSITTYFRDRGHVQNKAAKQGRLQQLCIQELEEFVTSLDQKDPDNSFIKQLQQALQLMRNRITTGGKNIPVLNFFIATLVIEIMDFMTGDLKALAVRRMVITPAIEASSSNNGAVSLAKIIVIYFRHNKETERLEPTQLTDDEHNSPLSFYQAWSKYFSDQEGFGLHSKCHDEYTEAIGQRFGEVIFRYLTNHPAYAHSVDYDRDETRKVLESINNRGACSFSNETDVPKFIFNPSGKTASLIDLWDQAGRLEANLGAGLHKQQDTVVRGSIYRETTNRTAFNIDHIFGARPAQIEQWAAGVTNGHAQAGKPELGYYGVVAGSSTLPCKTKEEAYLLSKINEKKRKKNFITEHPELAGIIGLSWEAASA